MDLIYFKIVILMHGWLFTRGSPVAMLQHATSSQSIVFHAGPLDTSTSGPNSSAERYGTRQPKYEYKYEVSDQQTGDRKSHWESREGDKVRGAYTLYEPDGALRTVEYTADAIHGFNAVVKRNEPNKHQLPDHSSLYPHNSAVNGHDSTTSGQKLNRKILSDVRDGETSNYSGSKSLFDSGVGFSVNHVVLKKFRGNENLY